MSNLTDQQQRALLKLARLRGPLEAYNLDIPPATLGALVRRALASSVLIRRVHFYSITRAGEQAAAEIAACNEDGIGVK